MSLCAQVHTPEVNVRSRLQLATPGSPIPGSRLNTRNSPGARPYCSCLPLKKKNFADRTKPQNLITRKFVTQIIFNAKISQSTVFFPCIVKNLLWWNHFNMYIYKCNMFSFCLYFRTQESLSQPEVCCWICSCKYIILCGRNFGGYG